MCEPIGHDHLLEQTPQRLPAPVAGRITIEVAIRELVAAGHLTKGATVVVIGSILVGEQIVDAVQMRTVD